MRGKYDTTGHKNMHQLIQLRWIAVLGQVATIYVVSMGFGVPLPLNYMLPVLGGLIAFNIVGMLRLRLAPEVTNSELLVAMLVDVGMLTAQLYLSGGATNPFVFLYLVQVTLGAVLLKPWSTWTLVMVTLLCFMFLAAAGRPLTLPLDHGNGLASLYVQGMLICFALNASLLVVFITRVHGNLRARDAHLADLRQRAAEEEHIVRMGLLASGAAHELGTPLATMAVILGDWRHMKPFRGDPQLLEEISEMQSAVARCKSIVGSILLSAGEARGEAPAETTVNTFLDDLVKDWRASRGAGERLRYDNEFGMDRRIVSDTALKQMICNVLDNAWEAARSRVELRAAHEDEGDALVVDIVDDGPGFAPQMLSRFGKPYQSSKGRPGGGLGLFLVVNVARTLGGQVNAENRPEGGARVTLRLPLSALTLEEDKDHAAAS
ncbi:ATP-binding protein [Bordetella genomosp. 9]|uniref:histidine kinase n=1 Tax=Bordetella genomosp. 9 TaxID=1416803 RepID=A0A1W6YXR0_9BORD|nr:ATP-binding protein [Bordetella genomosp. 9]ARP85754.1 histidine kinase [Bordetella genomosp. 9]ARP89731.1 histidine kinase [Bordetella genomosp. 9]